jgi:hypothetical protein
MRRGPQHANRRCQRRKRPGQHRDDEGDGQHRGVHDRLVEARHVGRPEGDDELHGAVGERHTARAADHGEDEILRQPLRHQASAAGAQREANRGLAPPRRRPREQEIRHIGARDQQHEANRANEDEEGRLRVADNRIVHARETDAPAFVGLRIGRLELRAERIHFGLRRRQPDAGPQAAGRDHEAAVARHPGHVVFDRRPHLRVVGGEAEPRRHHADDQVRAPLEHDRRADDVPVAAEEALPDAVAEHQHFLAAGTVVGRFDDAAKEGRRAQHRKQRTADARAEHPLGKLETGDVEGPAGRHAEAFERGQLTLPVFVIRKRAAGDRSWRARAVVEEDDHARRITVRRRLQDDRAHHAEDGGVRADAQGERDDGRGREAGRAEEKADGVAHVAGDRAGDRSARRRWPRR